METDLATPYATLAELEAEFDWIRQSPKDGGTLELIVRRPQVESREILAEAELNPAEGLAGDTWNQRPSTRTADGSPHPDMQLTLINTRLIARVARQKDRWPLAGDQLFVDLDLSTANLPPGTRLALGSAVIEITAQPHTGCKKFLARFGVDAVKFVNSPLGKRLRLRGMNAKVARPGVFRVGDVVRKV